MKRVQWVITKKASHKICFKQKHVPWDNWHGGNGSWC